METNKKEKEKVVLANIGRLQGKGIVLFDRKICFFFPFRGSFSQLTSSLLILQ